MGFFNDRVMLNSTYVPQGSDQSSPAAQIGSTGWIVRTTNGGANYEVTMDSGITISVPVGMVTQI